MFEKLLMKPYDRTKDALMGDARQIGKELRETALEYIILSDFFNLECTGRHTLGWLYCPFYCFSSPRNELDRMKI